MDKKRMQWARKVLLTTTNGIFPGVLEHYKTSQEIESSPNSAMIRRRMAASTVRVHSSLPIQVLLHASSSFFVIYFICVLGTLDNTLNRLKNFHKVILLTLSSLCFVMNICRYFIGFSANLTDDAIKMTSYWMLTLTQIPFLLFILFTDLFSPVLQSFSVTMDSVIFCLVLAELLISFSHTRRLLMNEITLMKLANESLKISERQKPETGSRPRSRTVNRESLINYHGISELNNEEEDETDFEAERDEEIRAPSISHRLDKMEPTASDSFQSQHSTITSEQEDMADQLKDSLGSETDQEIITLFKPAEHRESHSNSNSSISSASKDGNEQEARDSGSDIEEIVARHDARDQASTSRPATLDLEEGTLVVDAVIDNDDNWSDYSDSDIENELAYSGDNLDKQDTLPGRKNMEESDASTNSNKAAQSSVHVLSKNGGMTEMFSAVHRGRGLELDAQSPLNERSQNKDQDRNSSTQEDAEHKDTKWGRRHHM